MISSSTTPVPVTEKQVPADAAELAGMVEQCFRSETAVYPVGGGTSLDYGVPATREGVALELSRLNSVVDYPSRDLTITVESGVTMSQLAETLTTERQWLPVDVPDAERATVGGIVATNANGPRMHGWGRLRDYVIGISAVDGRGSSFRGGGRVVKNVAGYDFCKLLTGSLGTLGVITQITFRVMPSPERSALYVVPLANEDVADTMLERINLTALRPTIVELMGGTPWRESLDVPWPESSRALALVVMFEGTEEEVSWQSGELEQLFERHRVTTWEQCQGETAGEMVRQMGQFPAAAIEKTTIRVSIVPSGVVPMIKAIRSADAGAGLLIHAANGVIIAQLDPDRFFAQKWRLLADRFGGGMVVLASPEMEKLSRDVIWGQAVPADPLLTAIKKQFDPKNILNPGRFVYPF